MSAIETLVTVRAPIPSDLSFIFNSWLKSYRNSEWARPMVNQVYFTAHHALIQDLLNHSKVYIACSKTNPSEIFGYIVAQRIQGIFTLHYVYVKHTFRQMGIAKLLLSCFDRLENEASCYTHHTHLAKKLAAARGFLYNPYLLTDIDSQKALTHESISDAVEEAPVPDVELEDSDRPMNNLTIEQMQNRIRNLEMELEEANEALNVGAT